MFYFCEMDRFIEVSVYRLKLQIWCINFAGRRKRACVRTNKLKVNISKCTSYLSYIGQIFDYNGYSCIQKLNLKVGSRAQLNLGLKLPFMWNSIQAKKISTLQKVILAKIFFLDYYPKFVLAKLTNVVNFSPCKVRIRESFYTWSYTQKINTYMLWFLSIFY